MSTTTRRLALALMATQLVPLATAADIKPFGFAQLTAESRDGDDALGFGADSVRTGFRFSQDRLSAVLLLDFNAGDLDARAAGTLPNVVKDVAVSYALDERYSLRFGQFKAPLGYDFLASGNALDIAKRGMEKGLVLERTLGIMLSGRKLGRGFGVDVGIFNPAGRSAATRQIGSGPQNQVGDDLSAALRMSFTPDEHWHAEAAFGTSQNAGGPATEDYRVLDLALAWQRAPWTLKAEYIDGRDVRGTRGRDERVWYAHAGYALSPRLSGVLRHYDGESELAGVATGLTNTFAGLTWFFDANSRTNARLMLNYVFTGGDQARYSGVSGIRGDTLLAQFQFDYRAE